MFPRNAAGAGQRVRQCLPFVACASSSTRKMLESARDTDPDAPDKS
jgi:hypothetical protein